jgi:hypothetical protein
MSFGESSAMVIIGALLRFALARPPRHLSIRPIGLIYINFQETGPIVMTHPPYPSHPPRADLRR